MASLDDYLSRSPGFYYPERAYHDTHLGAADVGNVVWTGYSVVVESRGNRIVFDGDVGNLESAFEVAAFIPGFDPSAGHV